MKNPYASLMSRFLAFLVDNIIIYSIVSLILSIIPSYVTLSNEYVNAYNYFVQNIEEIIISNDITILVDILVKALLMLGYFCLVAIPFFIIYFIVVPKFWQKQTIGRLIAGVRVVRNKDGEEASVGSLILREIVGGFVFYWLLGASGVIIILTCIFSYYKGRSLSDLISRTKLIDVRTNIIIEDNNPIRDDSIDAEFSDINREEPEDSFEESSDEEYKVI